MSGHDFRRLSGLDFEELVHDLLEATWGVRLEAFSAGPDGGVDLRRIDADGGRTIIQCKNLAGSPFSTLLSKMRNEEVPKIVRLAPERYMLVTSVGLTPDNKRACQCCSSPMRFVRPCSPMCARKRTSSASRRSKSCSATMWRLSKGTTNYG